MASVSSGRGFADDEVDGLVIRRNVHVPDAAPGAPGRTGGGRRRFSGASGL